jgi:CheY-like chemotaxis protein
LKLIDSIRDKADVLDGKKVLVVDDDVRNLFALTAVFERSKIEVITAESGREALEMLNEDKTIDIVLMDIMMPEMDGYETIQFIRKEPKYKSLPIIAVTAKAMIGDRQKCIASGASDYITKPVKTDQLLSLMRVWLIK